MTDPEEEMSEVDPMARPLSGSELVRISRLFAQVVGGDLELAKQTAMSAGLGAGRLPLGFKDANGFWFEVVRLLHNGASEEAGVGIGAVASLATLIRRDHLGNKLIMELCETLMTPGRIDVFLSYATKDRADVDQLYDTLATTETLSVFQDHRHIDPGQDWLSALKKRVSKTSVMLCWVTDNYVQSTFSSYEVGLADSCGSRVIPVFVNDVQETSDVPQYLIGRQGIRVKTPVSFELVGRLLTD